MIFINLATLPAFNTDARSNEPVTLPPTSLTSWTTLFCFCWGPGISELFGITSFQPWTLAPPLSHLIPRQLWAHTSFKIWSPTVTNLIATCPSFPPRLGRNQFLPHIFHVRSYSIHRHPHSEFFAFLFEEARPTSVAALVFGLVVWRSLPNTLLPIHVFTILLSSSWQIGRASCRERV